MADNMGVNAGNPAVGAQGVAKSAANAGGQAAANSNALMAQTFGQMNQGQPGGLQGSLNVNPGAGAPSGANAAAVAGTPAAGSTTEVSKTQPIPPNAKTTKAADGTVTDASGAVIGRTETRTGQITNADGQTESRTYNVFKPSNLDPAQKHPVIFAFHGGGGNNDDFEALTGLDKQAAEQGAIVVYPQASENDKGRWNDNRKKSDTNDLGFFDQMVKEVQTQDNADPQRIYATGKSNGGLFVNRLGQERSETLAAIAPVAAGIVTNHHQDEKHAAKPLSVLAINGKDDPVMPYNGGKLGSTQGGSILSHQQTMQHWLGDNGASTGPGGAVGQTTTIADTNANDGSSATRTDYVLGNGVTVSSIDIAGGGHTWPGDATKDANNAADLQSHRKRTGEASFTNYDFSASATIMDFFLHHPKT